MSAPPPPAAPPKLPAMDNTMGALLIGTFVSCALLGITSVQLYFYLGRFPRDSKWTKSFVIYVWAIDALQTCLQCHALYFYLVSHYADPSVLPIAIWSLILMPFLEAIIGGPVEVFFAWRVWKLSEGSIVGKILTIVIAVLSVFHSCLGIAFTARTMVHRDLAWWHHMQWDTTAGLSSAAAADILIAACMVYLLRARRTVFEQSRNLINKLIAYSVETGLLTSIWALIVVIAFVTMPGNLVAVGILFILPKLYANSMMAMLNSRDSMARGQSTDRSAIQLPSHSHPKTPFELNRLNPATSMDRTVVESQFNSHEFDRKVTVSVV